MQAEFFGLLGLADKASIGLDQHSQRALGDDAGPSSPVGSIEYDSVYVETGFHPVKSEFGALQQQQAATMQVSLLHTCIHHNLACMVYVCEICLTCMQVLDVVSVQPKRVALMQ